MSESTVNRLDIEATVVASITHAERVNYSEGTGVLRRWHEHRDEADAKAVADAVRQAYGDLPMTLAVAECLVGWNSWDAIIKVSPKMEGIDASYYLVRSSLPQTLDLLPGS